MLTYRSKRSLEKRGRLFFCIFVVKKKRKNEEVFVDYNVIGWLYGDGAESEPSKRKGTI